MLVLAVDIGLRVNGYVVCVVDTRKVELIKEGEIKPPVKSAFAKRLFFIHKGVSKIIENYKPEALILEKLYSHHRHPTTVSLLAQVRGAILILTEVYKIGFYEYSTTRIRKSFLGKGSARSYQVKKAAENILGMELKSKHIADAFSLASAFSHTLAGERLISQPELSRIKV